MQWQSTKQLCGSKLRVWHTEVFSSYQFTLTSQWVGQPFFAQELLLHRFVKDTINVIVLMSKVIIEITQKKNVLKSVI